MYCILWILKWRLHINFTKKKNIFVFFTYETIGWLFTYTYRPIFLYIIVRRNKRESNPNQNANDKKRRKIMTWIESFYNVRENNSKNSCSCSLKEKKNIYENVNSASKMVKTSEDIRIIIWHTYTWFWIRKKRY